MTAVFALVLRFIIQTGAPDAIKISAFLFFMFYPVHPFYSVTIWKDIPFSITFLIFIVLLLKEQKEHSKKNCAGLFTAAFLMTLFRHNGIYILLLSLPFIYSAFPYNRKRIYMAFGAAILCFLGWKTVLHKMVDIPTGERSEAFSIPLQQLALSVKRHPDMEKDLYEEILSRFGGNDIGGLYLSRIADPVKNLFDEDLYTAAPLDFWKLWLKVGLIYPQDYVDAFLIHTCGYWYPDTARGVFVEGIDDDGIYGIHMDPKLDTALTRMAIQWLTESKYDDFPLISLLFSPGACFWVYLICLFYCLYRKSDRFFLLIPVMILWLTAIASPVNGEYRYVYGMFLCLPVILSALSASAHELFHE